MVVGLDLNCEFDLDFDMKVNVYGVDQIERLCVCMKVNVSVYQTEQLCVRVNVDGGQHDVHWNCRPYGAVNVDVNDVNLNVRYVFVNLNVRYVFVNVNVICGLYADCDENLFSSVCELMQCMVWTRCQRPH